MGLIVCLGERQITIQNACVKLLDLFHVIACTKGTALALLVDLARSQGWQVSKVFYALWRHFGQARCA